jgi:predicted DNA-binding protein (UPF0251 family)
LQIIGHIEFHIKDEADIFYRAFETCAMMKRKKPNLDIFQIIVYMGEKPAENILARMTGRHFTYELKVIQFIDIPVEVFLNADSAAEVVLGILGNFGGKSPEIVIPQLVEKVIKYAKTDLERLKFLQHLRIFGKLRNFEPLINSIMENTIAYFGLKDEDDYMYKRGEAKAKASLEMKIAAQSAEAEKKTRFAVIRLLDTKTMTEEQIMDVLDVSKEFVQTIQIDLAAAIKKIARLKTTKGTDKIAEKLNVPTAWVEKQVS